MGGSGGIERSGHVLPIAATFRGDASADIRADATVRGAFEVKMPSSVDPGQMIATVVRAGLRPATCARIALIDVDGLLLNQNFGSLISVGDNPLASLRDKLEAACAIPRWRESYYGSIAPAAASRPVTSWPKSCRFRPRHTNRRRLPDGFGHRGRVFPRGGE